MPFFYHDWIQEKEEEFEEYKDQFVFERAGTTGYRTYLANKNKINNGLRQENNILSENNNNTIMFLIILATLGYFIL